MKMGLNVESSTMDVESGRVDQKESVPELATSDLNTLMVSAVICLITIVGHFEVRGPVVCKVFNELACYLSATVILTQSVMDVVKLPKWVQDACSHVHFVDVVFFSIAAVSFAIAGNTK